MSNIAHIYNEDAYLELILGPMFSGKTSKLIQLHKQYTLCKIPSVVINHTIDKRYHETLLSSHDKNMIECMQESHLMPIYNKVADIKAILINEGQFFPDLYEFVITALADGKRIHIASLNGDFNRKLIGHTHQLLPLANEINLLHAICNTCKKSPGIFSKRITAEKQQIVVGFDNYVPTCRKCFNLCSTENSEECQSHNWHWRYGW